MRTKFLKSSEQSMPLFTRIFRKVLRELRVSFFKTLSTNKASGKFCQVSPVLFEGKGSVEVGEGTVFGVIADANFWNGYSYLNARTENSRIIIGEECQICNQFNAVSEGPGIVIGNKVLIGSQVSIYDSDFHEITPERRTGGTPKMGKVTVGNNVWIGDRVTILKGSSIGDNSVVAAGAVVSGVYPANVIIGGVPAKIIRQI